MPNKPANQPAPARKLVRKLSQHELIERQVGPDNLAASYWHERLLEYRCAFTDLSTMVTVLMAYEPQFRCAQSRDRVRRALKGSSDAVLLRLTVETIRRHLASSPAVEKLYKSLRKAGLSDFTGTVPKAKAAKTGELSLEDAALRDRLTRPTRRCKPADHPAHP